MVAGYCGVCCGVCACLCGSCLREFVVLGGLRLMVWCFGSAESGFGVAVVLVVCISVGSGALVC